MQAVADDGVFVRFVRVFRGGRLDGGHVGGGHGVLFCVCGVCCLVFRDGTEVAIPSFDWFREPVLLAVWCVWTDRKEKIVGIISRADAWLLRADAASSLHWALLERMVRQMPPKILTQVLRCGVV